MSEQEAVNLKEAVSWVANNYELVVRDNPSGPNKLDFAKAGTPPPSNLARSYMRWAAKNETKFFSDVLPKVQPDEDDATDDVVKAKKSIGNMKRMLMRLTAGEPKKTISHKKKEPGQDAES